MIGIWATIAYRIRGKQGGNKSPIDPVPVIKPKADYVAELFLNRDLKIVRDIRV